MSTTAVFRAWIGAGANSTSGTVYGPAWDVPADITNAATINIVIRHSSLNNGGYLKCVNYSGTNTSDYYICNSSGGNAIKIQTFSHTGNYTWSTNNYPVSVNLRAFAGSGLYVKEVTTAGNGVHMYGDCAFTVTYDTYTNCTAPTTVACSRVRGVVTINWAGYASGTNNGITGFDIIRNTSQSTSGATTIYTNVTSGNQTNSPGAGTFYYGVRSKATYNNSGYGWSGAVVVPAKPTVSAGDKITEAQMDALRIWINGSQTDVGQHGIAYASHGNTYRSGLTAGTTQFDDTWYNNASNG